MAEADDDEDIRRMLRSVRLAIDLAPETWAAARLQRCCDGVLQIIRACAPDGRGLETSPGRLPDLMGASQAARRFNLPPSDNVAAAARRLTRWARANGLGDGPLTEQEVGAYRAHLLRQRTGTPD